MGELVDEDGVIDYEELQKLIPEDKVGVLVQSLGEYVYKTIQDNTEWDITHFDEQGVIPRKDLKRKDKGTREHCFVTATSPRLTVMMDGEDTKAMMRRTLHIDANTGAVVEQEGESNVIDSVLILRVNGVFIHIFANYVYIARTSYDVPMLKKMIFREG
jgi:hypothetical protein